jgi:signal transduction histidine kinase/ActR/RegA family two-component response regulator
LAFRILLTGTEAAYWGTLAVTVYTVVLLQAGRDYSAATRRNLALRYANLDLVQELTAKREEAERANRAKSQFLAAASHDLRQPLQALSLLTGTLKLRSTSDADRQLAERISSSVEALDGLLNALLDISKLDAAVIHPERGAIALDSLFTRLERDAAPTAEAKGLRLRVRPSGLWANSDPLLLRRILQNLLANAIRYTRAGSVWMGARRRGGSVRIEIRDSGEGIAPEHIERVFEEFYQVSNAERDRRKGLGLGLAIVRRLAALLDHPLEVRSAPARGSVFAITLPLAEAPPEQDAGEAAEDAATDFRGLRVLLFEDDVDVREAIALSLRHWGCSVLAASDAEEAMTALAARAPWRPDLIVTDYRLRGGGNGAQAAQGVIARLGGKTPVVVITGDTGAEPIESAQRAGSTLLHKPVRADRLRQILLELTGSDNREHSS